jgi:hypothetical protein
MEKGFTKIVFYGKEFSFFTREKTMGSNLKVRNKTWVV